MLKVSHIPTVLFKEHFLPYASDRNDNLALYSQIDIQSLFIVFACPVTASVEIMCFDLVLDLKNITMLLRTDNLLFYPVFK